MSGEPLRGASSWERMVQDVWRRHMTRPLTARMQRELAAACVVAVDAVDGFHEREIGRWESEGGAPAEGRSR